MKHKGVCVNNSREMAELVPSDPSALDTKIKCDESSAYGYLDRRPSGRAPCGSNRMLQDQKKPGGANPLKNL